MNSVAGAQFVDEAELDVGVAGASARRQHRRLVEESGLGWISSLEAGAEDEELLAAHLARYCPEAIVLHDRAMPSARTNIDHLAVAPNGVWVIAAARASGWIKVLDDRLMIDGYDRSSLIARLSPQRDAVREAIHPLAPDLPVHACFCFLDCGGRLGKTSLSLVRNRRIDDFPIVSPHRLAGRINRGGALPRDEAREAAGLLAAAFPRA